MFICHMVHSFQESCGLNVLWQLICLQDFLMAVQRFLIPCHTVAILPLLSKCWFCPCQKMWCRMWAFTVERPEKLNFFYFRRNSVTTFGLICWPIMWLLEFTALWNQSSSWCIYKCSESYCSEYHCYQLLVTCYMQNWSLVHYHIYQKHMVQEIYKFPWIFWVISLDGP